MKAASRKRHLKPRSIVRSMRFLGRVVDYCRALGPMLGLRW